MGSLNSTLYSENKNGTVTVFSVLSIFICSFKYLLQFSATCFDSPSALIGVRIGESSVRLIKLNKISLLKAINF